jgi:hypothetical protein
MLKKLQCFRFSIQLNVPPAQPNTDLRMLKLAGYLPYLSTVSATTSPPRLSSLSCMQKRLLFSLVLLAGCSAPAEKQPVTGTQAPQADKSYSIRSISISLPNHWEQLAPLPSGVYPFRNSQCDTTLAFCENFTLNFQPNTAHLSLAQVESSILAALPNRYKQLKIISSQDITIESTPAKLIDYMFMEQNMHLGSTIGVLIRKDTVVVLTGMALNQPEGSYTNYRPTLVRIITSLSGK